MPYAGNCDHYPLLNLLHTGIFDTPVFDVQFLQRLFSGEKHFFQQFGFSQKDPANSSIESNFLLRQLDY